MTTIAIIAATLLIAMAVLQVALALGAPLGAYVWGGSHEGRLPLGLRIGSGVASALLPFMALILLARAGVTDWSPLPADWLTPAAWVIVGSMTLNTVGNLTSQTKIERFVFGTLTAVLAVLASIIASASAM